MLLHVFILILLCRVTPGRNPDVTGSYWDITVNNLGNTGVYRHEPWLHRAAP